MKKTETKEQAGERTQHDWTGNGPQLQEESLSDGSKVYNVTLSDETFFCINERAAIQLIADLEKVIARAEGRAA